MSKSAASRRGPFRVASIPFPPPLLLWFLSLGLCLVAPAALAQDLPDQPSTPDDIPGMVAVDLDDDLSDAEVDAFASDLGVTLEPTSALTARTRLHRAAIVTGSVQAWLARARGDSRVEVVEPLARVHASWTPNDPMLDKQWHLRRIGAEQAWSYATGRGVTVAVVDTGIACEDRDPFNRLSDLADSWCLSGFNVLANTPFASDDNGHGSHVAGTIAQSTNNGLAVAGVAFQARLLPVKVLNAQGWGTTVSVADGIRWAADAGAHVINLSLGGARASRVTRSAIEHARSKGVVIVAAAGNNGRFVEYPAAFDGVIAVSATDASDALARFSSRGKQVDIAAPGVDVHQQTICDGGQNKCEFTRALSGTSMAAPHVAGAAALLMSVGVTDGNRVAERLAAAAVPPPGQPAGGPLFGAGILHAGDAVRSAVWSMVGWRLALLCALTLCAVHLIRKRNGAVHPWKAGLVLGGLAFGPGLLFFLPLVASRVPLGLDLLARPIPEWDLVVGVSVHRWLPLANFFVPLAFSAAGFGIKRLRPMIAGVALGTAAYLLSLPLLRISASDTKSMVLLALWAGLNALGCLWLAILNLDERER